MASRCVDCDPAWLQRLEVAGEEDRLLGREPCPAWTERPRTRVAARSLRGVARPRRRTSSCARRRRRGASGSASARPRAHKPRASRRQQRTRRSPAKHLEVAIGNLGERCRPGSRHGARRARRRGGRGLPRPPRARRTPRPRRPRAPDARRSRGRRPEDRSRAPRRARSSRGRSGSAPDRRRFAATRRQAVPTRSVPGHERARTSGRCDPRRSARSDRGRGAGRARR